MRIFSKFQDYYDSVIAYGIDQNTVFERKRYSLKDDDPQCIDLFKSLPVVKEAMRTFLPSRYNFRGKICLKETIAVLFCGKLYTSLIFGKYDSDRRGITLLRCCYDIESIENFYAQNKAELPKHEKKSRWRRIVKSKENIVAFFNKYQGAESDDFIDAHFKMDAPIILFRDCSTHLSSWRVVVNPILKDLRFYRIVDSFTAFQELSMFIGGVMGKKSPAMVEISDNNRIAKHGFDKWSFRKESSKAV
jgi:hypothetical protein